MRVKSSIFSGARATWIETGKFKPEIEGGGAKPSHTFPHSAKRSPGYQFPIVRLPELLWKFRRILWKKYYVNSPRPWIILSDTPVDNLKLFPAPTRESPEPRGRAGAAAVVPADKFSPEKRRGRGGSPKPSPAPPRGGESFSSQPLMFVRRRAPRNHENHPTVDGCGAGETPAPRF